jgi:alanyl aminopeptidase
MVAAGRAPVAVARDLAAALGARPDRASLVAATEIVDRLDARVPAAERAAWSAWLVERFGRRARALGVAPRRFERPVDGELRRLLLHLAAELGGAPDLVAEACALAQRAGDDEAAVPAEVRSIARAGCDR